MKKKLHPDAALIDRLGGPSEVARRLAFDNPQRVHNWKSRGIPLLLKYQHEDVFGPMPARKPSKRRVA